MPLLKKDVGITEQDIDRLLAKARAFTPPEKAFTSSWPLTNLYFSPTTVGTENLTDKPTLFVGNHALFGIDILVFLITLHHETGRFARVLGDKFFFASPVGEMLMKYGMVLADEKLCSALMEDQQDLLVFPGGALESTQPAAEKYTLNWGDRYGFVRVAAENGYNITPFGLVGPDDCYDHILEGNELLDTRLGKLLTKFGLTEDVRPDLLPPITRGLLYTQLPKPQPSYLAFGETVELPDCRGKEVPEEVLKSARAETAEKIEALLAEMLQLRSTKAEEVSWLRRKLVS